MMNTGFDGGHEAGLSSNARARDPSARVYLHSTTLSPCVDAIDENNAPWPFYPVPATHIASADTMLHATL
jgi:hypothetical protein